MSSSIYHDTDVRLTWRIPKDIKDVLDLVVEHKKISFNNLANDMARSYIKQLVLSGALPAAIEASVGIPVQIVTARILGQLETAADCAKEIREMGLSGTVPTWEIFESVRKMVNPEVKQAIEYDIQQHGPLVWYGPDDPRAIAYRKKMENPALSNEPKPIIENQEMSQADIHDAGAFLDVNDADEILAQDLREASSISLDGSLDK